MKIFFPVESAEQGGNLYPMIDDLSNLNSEVSKTRDNGVLTIDDTNTSESQKLAMDQANLLLILAESGGEMTEYIMGIRVPNTFAVQDVPVGLPKRKNVLGEIRKIKDWYVDGAEVWREDGGNEFIFYTNPFGGLSSIADYLTGSEMEIIRQVNVSTHTILSVEEVAVIVATGWTKVDWENL